MTEDNTTENDDVRWKYLNSGIAGLIMLTLVILLLGSGVGVITLAAISQAWFFLFATAVATVLVWAFGKESYQSFKGN